MGQAAQEDHLVSNQGSQEASVRRTLVDHQRGHFRYAAGGNDTGALQPEKVLRNVGAADAFARGEGFDCPRLLDTACADVTCRAADMAEVVLGTWEEMACFGGKLYTCLSDGR